MDVSPNYSMTFQNNSKPSHRDNNIIGGTEGRRDLRMRPEARALPRTLTSAEVTATVLALPRPSLGYRLQTS